LLFLYSVTKLNLLYLFVKFTLSTFKIDTIQLVETSLDSTHGFKRFFMFIW